MASLDFFVPPNPCGGRAGALYTRALMPAAGFALGGGAWWRAGRFLGPNIEALLLALAAATGSTKPGARPAWSTSRTSVMSLGGGLVMWGSSKRPLPAAGGAPRACLLRAARPTGWRRDVLGAAASAVHRVASVVRGDRREPRAALWICSGWRRRCSRSSSRSASPPTRSTSCTAGRCRTVLSRRACSWVGRDRAGRSRSDWGSPA